MDFRLNPEQEMLRDSVRAVLARCGDDRWGPALAEAGMLGILVPEDDGGLGLGMVEAQIVAQECGYRNVPFPIAETLSALPLLARILPAEARAVMAGEGCLTASVTARLAVAGARVGGEVKYPFHCDLVRVAAPLDDGRVVLIAPGCGRARPAAGLDPLAPNVMLDVDAGPGDLAILADAGFIDRLGLLRLAEMAGAARFCFETAVQYLKDRSQFGRPIGANQSLKHIAAEDFVRQENIRVALEYACAAHDHAAAHRGDAEMRQDARDSLDVAMAYCPDAARTIAQNAMQMHGGIGVTSEYVLNGPVRRILRLGGALGEPEAYRRALARSLLARRDTEPACDTAAE